MRLDHRPGENRRFALADGTFAYDGDTGDFDLTKGGVVVVDPFGSIRAAIEAKGADGWHLVDLTTPLDREVARFTAEWPLLAAMLGVAAGPSGAFRLFDPGVTCRVKVGPAIPRASTTSIGTITSASIPSASSASSAGTMMRSS